VEECRAHSALLSATKIKTTPEGQVASYAIAQIIMTESKYYFGHYFGIFGTQKKL
jgi:hypothetical protein